MIRSNRCILKYFGSAFFSLIESVVDMAMVGQYQRLIVTAALALVSPIWNIIYSLGFLIGSRYYQISLKKKTQFLDRVFFLP